MKFGLPRIRKKLAAFLSEEDGSIAKQAIITAGVTAVLAGAAQGVSETKGGCDENDYLSKGASKTSGSPDPYVTVTHYNKAGFENPPQPAADDWNPHPNTELASHGHCVEWHYSHASY